MDQKVKLYVVKNGKLAQQFKILVKIYIPVNLKSSGQRSKVFDPEIGIFRQNRNFAKNRNLEKKVRILPRIEIFVKNGNFGQNLDKANFPHNFHI